MVHGVDCPAAVHVPLSVIPLTTTFVDVKALRSAIPPGTEIVLISTMRKRRRVTGAPVLFTKRRRTESVPFVAFGNCGDRSRTRFGGAGAPMLLSSSNVRIVLLRLSGLPRFSGPGAPSRWPCGVAVPDVSA